MPTIPDTQINGYDVTQITDPVELAGVSAYLDEPMCINMALLGQGYVFLAVRHNSALKAVVVLRPSTAIDRMLYPSELALVDLYMAPAPSEDDLTLLYGGVLHRAVEHAMAVTPTPLHEVLQE
jgi:hypothetical protein